MKKIKLITCYQILNLLKHDGLTESTLPEYFDSSGPAILMCLYNTLGVIHSDKRQMFVEIRNELQEMMV